MELPRAIVAKNSVHRALRLAIAGVCGCLSALAVAQEIGEANGGEQTSPRSDLHAAVVTFLASQDLPNELRGAMLETLRDNPSQSSWAVRREDRLLAVAARRLPEGPIRQQAAPGILKLTHAVAVADLLKTQASLEAYDEEGLSDAAVLRTAMIRATGRLHVTGGVRGVTHQTARQGDFAVGYAVATTTDVVAYLHQPAVASEVKRAYRDVIHEKMRASIEQERWSEAIDGWKHLDACGLESDDVYVDATRCLIELDRGEEAVDLVERYLQRSGATAGPDTLEKLGDLLLKVKSAAAEDMATTAYRAASDRLRNFRGAGENEPDGSRD